MNNFQYKQINYQANQDILFDQNIIIKDFQSMFEA